MKAPLSWYTDEELTAELSARVQRRQALSDIDKTTKMIDHLIARAAHEEAQGNAGLAAQYREWAEYQTIMRNEICENVAKGCWHEQPPPVHRPGESLEIGATPTSLQGQDGRCWHGST